MKYFFLLIGILCAIVLPTHAQLSNVTVDPGPYTPGSTIAATFKIDPNSCITQGNRFNLRLSDAAGNFSPGQIIGSYDGFYSTFVNGTIPNTIVPGGSYKIKIESTQPTLTTAESIPFAIQALPPVVVNLNSNRFLKPADPQAMGFCSTTTGAGADIAINKGTSSGDVTAIITDESTQSTNTLNISPGVIFQPAQTHYTMLAKVLMPNGTVGTRAYFIINNKTITTLNTAGNNTVCLESSGGTLTYPIDRNALLQNFPGDTYSVTWGDGTSNVYTICDLKSGFIQHTYTRSSCGQTINSGGVTTYNSFGINLQLANPYCGPVGTPLSTSARVINITENRISGPPIGCTRDEITFRNVSILGDNPNNNGPCQPDNATFNWYIDGVFIQSGTINDPLIHRFPTAGTHIIELESVNPTGCRGPKARHVICVQDPPKPDFVITTPTTGCAPFLVKIKDQSIIDQSCALAPAATYNWIITNASGVRFTAFTNNVKDPEFTLTDPGVYKVELEISSGACGVVKSGPSTPLLIINGQPTIALSPATKLCRLGSYKFDNIPNTPTRTIFTGTQVDLPDTYTWTVTDPNGGALTNDDYLFDVSTSSSTKYPSISFRKNRIYKVTVTHKNSCASVTESQLIEFVAAPEIILGADQNICFNEPFVNLTAIVNGSVLGARWTGGLGVFSDKDSKTTTYIPTLTERINGVVTLNFTVDTDLQPPCSTVTGSLKIFIKKEILVTSAAASKICTGTALNYAPTTNLANSNYTWTATGTANASGYASNTTPSFLIPDILTNSDPVNPATVTYVITPTNDGCAGVPFTYVVTITPKPVISANAAAASVCSNQPTAITITSNLVGTKYTWTNNAPAGVSGASTVSSASAASTINDILINNTAIAQTVVYTISPISDNNCGGDPVTVAITVQPMPTTAKAGPDDSICSNAGNYVLKGEKAIVGTGKWEQVTTFPGITITPDSQENATVSGLQEGNKYTFRWTITSAPGCSSSDEVEITVNPISVGGKTSGPAVVCGGNNTGVITLSDQVGSVIRWERATDGTNWTAVANTTTTLTFNNLTVATQFRAVVQSGACPLAYSDITSVSVNEKAATAVAGPDQTLCNASMVILAGNDPLLNTGEWTLTSGQAGVVIQDPAKFNTTVNGLTGGQTYIFQWKINGPPTCGATIDEVTITNLPELLNNNLSTPITNTCTGQVITITGTVPTGGNGSYAYTWESSATGAAPWTLVNGQTGRDLNVTVTGSLSYRRTVTSGSCANISNTITLVALPSIATNTISQNQTICANINPEPLTGSQPTGGDGSNYNFGWEQSLDGNTWVPVPGNIATPNFTPPMLTQTTFYRRLVSSAACAGSLQSISNVVKITIKPAAKAEFTFTNDLGCIPFVIDATNIKAVAYPDRNSTYSWYADGVLIGTGLTFPGYTITTDDKLVLIKLVTESSLGCSTAETSHAFSTRQDIVVAFTQTATVGCGPLTVDFKNTSTNQRGTTFKWDFGNGQTSNLQNPAPVVFQTDPTGNDIVYTVKLETITPCGSKTFESTVTVRSVPRSVFSPNKTLGCSPLPITFSNTSPGLTNTYFYDFGDGTTLTTTDKNAVTHTYTTAVVQDFTVKMLATNECGSSESQYTIRVSPNTITPELVVNANQLSGCAPLTVDFFNNTKGASFYQYTFGDGSVITSNSITAEKQTHIFTKPGTYTVELLATNGCSTATTREIIQVLPQPTPNFGSDKTNGCEGLVVKFSNTSVDAISYLWDFGDGSTSTEVAPTHTFKQPANSYTIKLTAFNTFGCGNTITKTGFIKTVAPPVADFTISPAAVISIPDYTFKFTDASTNAPQTYKWSFGDGDVSTQKDPTHKYTDTGKYLVTMRTFNEYGCVDSVQKQVQIVGVPGYVYLPNSFIPGGTSTPLQTFMAVGSGIKTWKMQVFNKWGQVIWQTTLLNDGKPVEGWDGTYQNVPQPQGIYFWKLEVELINGTEWKGMTYDSKPAKRMGEIYLIR